MSIHVFLRSAGQGVEARRKRQVLHSFHKGLRVEGEDAQLDDSQAYKPCDVAVVLGGRSIVKHATTREVRDDIFARHKGAFVFVETPLLGRDVYRRPMITAYARKLLRLGRNRYSDEYGYYRVAVNGFLQDDADFNNTDSPPDRWALLSQALGLRLKPYRREGRHILIVGQNPGDASLRGADIFEWMYLTVMQARRVTARPIVVRPHPVTPQSMMKEFERLFMTIEGIVVDHPPNGPIQTALQDCWVMLAYSSSATIDALIQGVPCITFSPANMAWPVSDHDLESIERPTLFDREQWLYDLAYAQWSLEEMEAGTAWRHLRPAVLRTRADASASSAGMVRPR